MSHGVRYTNPVYEGHAADPTVVKGLDGTYYLYATGNVRLRSADLVHWSDAGQWGVKGAPAVATSVMWAPDVARVGDLFAFSWSGGTGDRSKDDGSKALYYATGPHAAGPFEFGGKLTGFGFPIDSKIFVDGGTPYLFWGGGAIYVAGLELHGTEVALTSREPQLLHRNVDATIEGPWVHKHGEWYYLFYSYGHWDKASGPPEYQVQISRSRQVTGPYTPPHQEADTILRGDDRFWGPGHNCVVTDDAGQDWIVYHAWHGDRRALMLDRIRYADGWPVINDGHPSSTEQPGPVVRG